MQPVSTKTLRGNLSMAIAPYILGYKCLLQRFYHVVHATNTHGDPWKNKTHRTLNRNHVCQNQREGSPGKFKQYHFGLIHNVTVAFKHQQIVVPQSTSTHETFHFFWQTRSEQAIKTCQKQITQPGFNRKVNTNSASGITLKLSIWHRLIANIQTRQLTRNRMTGAW